VEAYVPIDRLKAAIRDVPNFPSEGIVFKDITPILSSPDLFKLSLQMMLSGLEGQKIDKIVGIDARGFIFGSAMADRLNCGFVPARKVGKLPWDSVKETYKLEYGEATLELHKDSILEGENIVIVDDLLATGGTARAAASLVTQLGGNIHSIRFFVELTFLPGRSLLEGYRVSSLIKI
jgi:adenine phosphoribosyltransferase